MKKIFLATDPKCWVEDRIFERKLGGTESWFLKIRDWLLEEYEVYDPVLNPFEFKINKIPDLTIFSNKYNEKYRGRKNIIRGGSWHVSNRAPVDLYICISEYFRKKMDINNAVVIPVPYYKEIENYRGKERIPNRIVSTSNPNRFFPHAIEVCEELDETKIDYEYHFIGGNKLYGEIFDETIYFSAESRLIYDGILSKMEVFDFLSKASVWIYPNFSDNSETFCVAAVEALALGIPAIVPDREPFLSVVPKGFFASDPQSMAIITRIVLENKLMGDLESVKMYSEEAVKPQIMKVIKELLS